ncbi:MAG: YraN family protein [Chloroflexi bacterium]|nr:YraN family protein [Chloroflexota bacterium]
MTKHNQEIGMWGEECAASWLADIGFEILARNVRTPHGEIDIIARQKGLTVFVEVKTLTSSENFFPEHQITARKREHMFNAAEYYAAENGIDHWQIDVISVEGKPGTKPFITHFENAI